MDLGRNIHQLLKHKKEVYVKGLGAFKRIRTSSVFDDQKGVFLPPVTYLEFDNKSEEGADFIDYVQQSNFLSRSEAEFLVEEKVGDIISSLADNGTVTLNYMGQLIKHGSSLVFKPEDITSFKMAPIPGENESNEGVLESSLAEPDKNVAITELPESPELDVIQQESTGVLETSATSEEEVIDELSSGRGKSFWYILVAIISVVIVAGLFYFNYSNNVNNLPVDPLANKPINEKLADSVAVEPDSLQLVENIVADTSQNKVYIPLIPENHTYQIVIGTHKTLALAYEQAESFNKAGIQSVRVIPSNLAHNKKKVIWDSYLTKEEADSALRYVRKHYVSDAWHQKVNK